MLFGGTPEKYEARALQYDRQGKAAKAVKYREKAARLRAGNQYGVMPTTGAPMMNTGAPIMNTAAPIMNTGVPAPVMGTRTPAIYEQQASKWEQRGNYTKAQKSRAKVWRMTNPQHAGLAAPQLYDNNRFLGYNVAPGPIATATTTPIAAPIASQTTTTSLLKQNLPTTTTTTTATTAPVQVVGQQFVQQPPVQLAPIIRERVEYQPIIIREIEIPEVHRTEQHIYETVGFQGERVVTNAPVVDTVVKPRVIEEIQPVVHRETAQLVVERMETHTTEHIVQPAIVTKTVESVNKGMVGVPLATAAGGPMLAQQNPTLMQQQQTTTTTTTTRPTF